MYLMQQDRDGRRTVATPNDVKSFNEALKEAKDHMGRHPETVALYLVTSAAEVKRTYFRSPSGSGMVVNTLYGYHEWPKPPTMFPGVLPEDTRTYWVADESHWLKPPEPRLGGFTLKDIHALRLRAEKAEKERDEARSSLQHEHGKFVSLSLALRELVSRY